MAAGVHASRRLGEDARDERQAPTLDQVMVGPCEAGAMLQIAASTGHLPACDLPPLVLHRFDAEAVLVFQA